jgi:acetyltransferase-like isoleucine patch superfamily enzyme
MENVRQSSSERLDMTQFHYRSILKNGYPLRELFWQFLRLQIVGPIARKRYAFKKLGQRVLIDPTADFSAANFIEIGDDSWIQKHCWLSVALIALKSVPSHTVISVGRNCSLGKRTMIAAAHRVIIEDNVLTSPNVLIMDHNHIYSDPSLPIKDQGITAAGEVTVEENCWIGMNACIVTKGILRIGRNSVVAANAVVTTDVPPHSLVAGNPARLVKRFDFASETWTAVPRD